MDESLWEEAEATARGEQEILKVFVQGIHKPCSVLFDEIFGDDLIDPSHHPKPPPPQQTVYKPSRKKKPGNDRRKAFHHK